MKKIFLLTLILISFSSIPSEKTFKQLSFVQKKIAIIERKIETNKKKLENESSRNAKREIQNDLKVLENELRESQNQFYTTASGIKFSTTTKAEEKKNLTDQLQDLLAPLFNSIKKASERPRKIQYLQNEKESLTAKIQELKKGIKTSEKLQQKNKNESLNPLFISTINEFKSKISDLEIKLEEVNQELDYESQNSISLWDKFLSIIKDFLGNKGRNLFLALIVFWGLYVGLASLRKYIFKLSVFNNKLATLKRPFKTLYGIFTLGIATVFSILCLYLLNDWVLVTLAILIVSSLLWSFKQYAPKFFEEIRLVLNLGSVREGQRLVWKGIPWKVRRIGFHSILQNENLEGTPVRVAAKELLKEHSRPISEGEPWYPTKKGDWVQLDDGVYGQIKLQTPEQTLIVLHGGTIKHYISTSFLALNPQNISQGFAITFMFGLDYKHQKDICTIIPQTIKKKVEERLAHRKFIDLIIEFHSAAESSLNLLIWAKCDGLHAYEKFRIERELHKAVVEVCNEENYEIPFGQLTVHLKKP